MKKLVAASKPRPRAAIFPLAAETLDQARAELEVKREDVDFENRQVTIGADCTATNAQHRSVNFSPELAEFPGSWGEGHHVLLLLIFEA